MRVIVDIIIGYVGVIVVANLIAWWACRKVQ